MAGAPEVLNGCNLNYLARNLRIGMMGIPSPATARLNIFLGRLPCNQFRKIQELIHGLDRNEIGGAGLMER